jgi:hypothetical protein
LAYVEVLDDEKATTAATFLRRAIAFYAARGVTVEAVMTDNGGAYRSAIRARVPRPGTAAPPHARLPPATNGKAERFIRTMLAGWAYGAIYRDSRERGAGTIRLARPLQLPTTTRRPQPPAPGQPARPADRNNLIGYYT